MIKSASPDYGTRFPEGVPVVDSAVHGARWLRGTRGRWGTEALRAVESRRDGTLQSKDCPPSSPSCIIVKPGPQGSTETGLLLQAVTLGGNGRVEAVAAHDAFTDEALVQSSVFPCKNYESA